MVNRLASLEEDMLAPEEVEVVGYKSEQEVVVEEECKPELEEVKVVVRWYSTRNSRVGLVISC